MTPERWRQIEEIYHAACERTPAEREVFLAEACGNDTELRRKVESLLVEDGSPTATVAGDGATVAAGSQFGPYRTEASIGKGGMGEVWKARDTRLNRDVAIKFSEQRFSGRFEREARAIAALNHPNICTLYDVGPNFLVMELVEGPTLAGRIARRLIPVEEALGIAKQIANALEAAHHKGIVHRDPQFSPDGHWMAYVSNESGRNEVVVVPFPGPGGAKRQISRTGGTQPRWRADGRELFYVAPDSHLMGAHLDIRGSVFDVKNVERLFGPVTNAGYDISADGQRFLALVPPEGETGGPLTVVQNWTAGLKK